MIPTLFPDVETIPSNNADAASVPVGSTTIFSLENKKFRVQAISLLRWGRKSQPTWSD